jgi:hypothetical protein
MGTKEVFYVNQTVYISKTFFYWKLWKQAPFEFIEVRIDLPDGHMPGVLCTHSLMRCWIRTHLNQIYYKVWCYIHVLITCK